MKIFLINTFDRGGAANACIRLHKGLINEGIDSKLLLRSITIPNIPEAYRLPVIELEKNIKNKLINKSVNILKRLKLYKNRQEEFIKSRSKKLEWFSFPNSNYDITNHKLFEDADIINLHWVANFLDYTSFFKQNTKPVVWTLHDMNPFSGGVHYEEIFLGFDQFGFPIPRQVSDKEKMYSKKNIKIKKQALSKVSNLTIVTPSEWLAEEARRSDVFKDYPVFCIPNGLDADIYAPRDKNHSRELLNIPKNKKVILFVADSISNNRKGFIFLKKAFEQIADANVVLCAIGNKNSNLELLNNIIELGSIYDERQMSFAYSAADVFVIPSLMDNLPNTVSESLMCGTPIIGFPVGGIPNMIQDGINGFITDEISVNSLVKTLIRFLDQPDYFDRKKIRDNAMKKYNLKTQSNSYIQLFKDIISKNN